MVLAMVYAGQKRVLGIHKSQNGAEILMHRAWVTHHHCPLALEQSVMGGAGMNVNQNKICKTWWGGLDELCTYSDPQGRNQNWEKVATALCLLKNLDARQTLGAATRKASMSTSPEGAQFRVQRIKFQNSDQKVY